MKKRITGDYGIHDYFKYYDSIYCEQKTFNAYNVGEKLYKSIIRDFLGEVNDNIIHNNFEFKLPSRLGTLSIKKFKREFKTDENGKIITKFPVDWKTTKDLWEKNPEAKKNKKLIYHFNHHTSNFEFKFKYDKRTANFPSKNVYMFKFPRGMKRTLAANLKNPKFKGDFFKL
tara:strand:+ start:2673 stop:3188 length:516 start_codon:yes stop_codon:yes gene_type:complete